MPESKINNFKLLQKDHEEGENGHEDDQNVEATVFQYLKKAFETPNNRNTDLIMFESCSSKPRNYEDMKHTQRDLEVEIRSDDLRRIRRDLMKPANWLNLESMKTADVVMVVLSQKIQEDDGRLVYTINFYWRDNIDYKRAMKRMCNYGWISFKASDLATKFLIVFSIFWFAFVIIGLPIILSNNKPGSAPPCISLESGQCNQIVNFANSTCFHDNLYVRN